MSAQPSPDLPDNLYQAAAEAWVSVSPWNTSDPAVVKAAVEEWATSQSFRAAVDEAFRLTEQRYAAIVTRWADRCETAWQEHDQARAEAEQLAADLAAMTARAESAEARAGWVDLSQLADAGTRKQCGHCGHEQFTPAGPLAPLATEIMANIRQVLGYLRQADEAYQVNLRALANDHVSAEAVAAYAIETTLKRLTAPGYGMRPEELALAVVDALRVTGHLDDVAPGAAPSATLPDGEPTVVGRDTDGPGPAQTGPHEQPATR